METHDIGWATLNAGRMYARGNQEKCRTQRRFDSIPAMPLVEAHFGGFLRLRRKAHASQDTEIGIALLGGY